MNPWPFIAGAYALTLLGVGGLLVVSLVSMRSAEREAERQRRDP